MKHRRRSIRRRYRGRGFFDSIGNAFKSAYNFVRPISGTINSVVSPIAGAVLDRYIPGASTIGSKLNIHNFLPDRIGSGIRRTKLGGSTARRNQYSRFKGGDVDRFLKRLSPGAIKYTL